jgi:hypothetical protein
MEIAQVYTQASILIEWIIAHRYTSYPNLVWVDQGVIQLRAKV